MADTLNIIVAVPPENAYALNAGGDTERGYTAARMIYGIGRGFRLYYYPRGARYASGGLMVLDIGGFLGGGPAAALISDVLTECKRRKYSGVVIDTGGRGGGPVRASLSLALASAADESGLAFFVPEPLADCGENAIIRVQTALSGGTLTRHLSDSLEKYGAQRVAVEIPRVCMDFMLPSRNGLGKTITETARRGLMERHNATAFYSPDLAVNYFTYREKNAAHFVLFDDAESIRNKLSLAEGLGIRHAFLFYPQVASILDEII